MDGIQAWVSFSGSPAGLYDVCLFIVFLLFLFCTVPSPGRERESCWSWTCYSALSSGRWCFSARRDSPPGQDSAGGEKTATATSCFGSTPCGNNLLPKSVSPSSDW